jgi:hypothetical protein
MDVEDRNICTTRIHRLPFNFRPDLAGKGINADSVQLSTGARAPRLLSRRKSGQDARGPRPPYNHFIHLKRKYGSTAASSIRTTALG